MTIPKYQVKEDDKVIFTYIDTKDIPEKYREEFLNWMQGQTSPIIEGCDAVYSWDWDRWLDNKLCNIPLVWD